MSRKDYDVEESVAKMRSPEDATRILSALRFIHVQGHVDQSLAMLAWAVDQAARVRVSLRDAKIAPPTSSSPSLHSPKGAALAVAPVQAPRHYH